jgi:hypothetical protein
MESGTPPRSGLGRSAERGVELRARSVEARERTRRVGRGMVLFLSLALEKINLN